MAEQGNRTMMYVIAVVALTLGGVYFLAPTGGGGELTGRATGFGAIVAEGAKASMLRHCRCVYTTGELLTRRGIPCDSGVQDAVEVHRVWGFYEGELGPMVVQSSRREMCEFLGELGYEELFAAEEGFVNDVGEGHLTEWLEKAGVAITPE